MPFFLNFVHKFYIFFSEWKWAMDPPDMILNGALEGHYKMIKQMKGVPGVLPERYAEGFKVKNIK